MTTYLVTRHSATRTWVDCMARAGRLPFAIDQTLEHLDPDQLKRGDVVVGTLPIHIAAKLHSMGVKFWSLDLDVPPADRGKELIAVQVQVYGGRFTRYEVRAKESEEVIARRRAAAKPQPSITLIPVSAQLAPAAIGWLHAPTEQVALLVSPGMRKQADLLTAWFKARVDPPRVDAMAWDDHDYTTLLAQADEWAAKFAAEARPQVVVNLTGGTKPMSMALQRAFGKHADAYGGALHGPYVDTAHRRIEDLLAPNAAPQAMQAVLNIRDLLALQGARITSAQSAAPGYPKWIERSELFDVLLDANSSSWLPAWYVLLDGADWLVGARKNPGGKRSYADRAGFATIEWQGQRIHPTFVVSVNNPKRQNWNGLIRALRGRFGNVISKYGVAEVELRAGDRSFSLTFDRKPLDELAFAAGTWLEAWLATQFVSAGVDEWAQGVQVTRGGVKNELDLVVACGNRTLLVEAKTGNLTRAGKQDSRATEAVYKLDSVAQQLGQYFNDRWLVSLRRLDDADRDRAEKTGITVFEGAADTAAVSMTHLRDAVAAWVAKSRLERGAGFVASALAAPLLGAPKPESGQPAHQAGPVPRNTALADGLRKLQSPVSGDVAPKLPKQRHASIGGGPQHATRG